MIGNKRALFPTPNVFSLYFQCRSSKTSFFSSHFHSSTSPSTHMSLSESTCVPPNLCQFLIFTKKRYIAINWRTGAPEKRVESSQKRVRLLAKAHPLLQQRGLRAYCETKRIDITCYGALAPLSRRGRGKELVVKDHCEVEGIRYHQVIRKTLFLL